MPVEPKIRIGKNVSRELKEALNKLLKEMKLSYIKVEGHLQLDCKSFVNDIVRTVDELNSLGDVIRLWHFPFDLATNVFMIITEVIFGTDAECEDVAEEIIEEIAEDSDDVASSEESSVDNAESDD